MDKNINYMPKISIIIITYNREEFIKEAIDSVLFQSFKDWQLIIIDDGSDDKTKELVKEYLNIGLNIKYVRNEKRLGISRARNLALSMCESKYIAVLDSDDLWCDSEKLQKQIDFLEKNKEYALVGTNAIFINNRGVFIKKSNVKLADYNIRKSILIRNQFFHSSVIFRNNIFKILRGYDESLKIGEDYDLFLRIGNKHKFANIKDCCIKYRVHNNSICVSDRICASRDTQNIIKKYRTYYPNYFFAFIKSYLRIFLAYLSKFLSY